MTAPQRGRETGPLPGRGEVLATGGVRQHCVDLGADAVFDKSETAGFIGWLHDLDAQENSGP